uniref:Uncharacterized protein n=1 Tax=Timema cristinae TaxID=61476 RepID=A0A7R9GU13_TIMCR|nr:unnamed protein product [Timema cristinae]
MESSNEKKFAAYISAESISPATSNLRTPCRDLKFHSQPWLALNSKQKEGVVSTLLEKPLDEGPRGAGNVNAIDQKSRHRGWHFLYLSPCKTAQSIHIGFLLAERKPTQLHKRKRWTMFISSQQADKIEAVIAMVMGMSSRRWCSLTNIPTLEIFLESTDEKLLPEVEFNINEHLRRRVRQLDIGESDKDRHRESEGRMSRYSDYNPSNRRGGTKKKQASRVAFLLLTVVRSATSASLQCLKPAGKKLEGGNRRHFHTFPHTHSPN